MVVVVVVVIVVVVVVVALPGTYSLPMCFVSIVDEVQTPNHYHSSLSPPRFLSAIVARKRCRDL